MSWFEVPDVDLSQYSMRQLVAPPLAVLVVALAVIGGWMAATGAPVSPGIEFTGGSEVVAQSSAPSAQVKAAFDAEPTSFRSVGTDGNRYLATFQSENAPGISGDTADIEIVQSQEVSPTFGSSTQGLALLGVAAAFLGMSVLVFALFRTFVPSIAVVVSAFSDIVVPVALMNVFGIKLSLGTVAALLMLIGYSVDSDILLNNHVLRRSGGFWESVDRAMNTGVTMTLTSIAAMVVMTIVSYIFGITLMSSIGLVLVMGLVTDLMNTYMLNVTLLRWYKFEGVAK
ncbi:protein translocase subunit SecF [Halobacterium salinarum]|uniref:protein translocase subunit SecF n=1 Tax=Halobacterium salinarum TaxID=2242 RepID=UPI001F40AF98|nr:protein translocase subunit SecF [Halobacterium salinarum]MCF2166229.1 protein translocase subunit SecF [Halobacterium salinarum]MCF2167712.1 protein translocase subunit SecF [Halobacterium salinarum]